MNSTIRLILIVIIAINLAGCGSFIQYMKDGDELYNSKDYTGTDRPTPYEVANFYTCNYSELSSNEKAVMIYNSCKYSKFDVYITEKEVVVKEKIVTWNGIRIWPVEEDPLDGTIEHLSNSLKKTGKELKEKSNGVE